MISEKLGKYEYKRGVGEFTKTIDRLIDDAVGFLRKFGGGAI